MTILFIKVEGVKTDYYFGIPELFFSFADPKYFTVPVKNEYGSGFTFFIFSDPDYRNGTCSVLFANH